MRIISTEAPGSAIQHSRLKVTIKVVNDRQWEGKLYIMTLSRLFSHSNSSNIADL
jgi:hypothetical protein